MGRIAALLLGICATLAFGTSAARAGAWQFVETGCQSIGPDGCLNTLFPPTTIALPEIVATFSSPDQSGTYMFTDDAGGVEYVPLPPGFPPNSGSGDANFTFDWEHFGGGPLTGGAPCDCSYIITWDGAPTSLEYFQTFSSTNIFSNGFFGNFPPPGPLVGTQGPTPFDIGSDGDIAGCGNLASNVGGAGCRVSGYWDPVGVPEASSVTLLGGALAFLTLLQLAFRSPRYRSYQG